MRTIRLFLLQGWAWYKGNLISDVGRLAAFFPWQDITTVKDKMNACRNWWFERDQFFHLRRQDGVVHLQQPGQHLPQRRETSVVLNQLSLLAYNCQSLGLAVSDSRKLPKTCTHWESQRLLCNSRGGSLEIRAVSGLYTTVMVMLDFLVSPGASL